MSSHPASRPLRAIAAVILLLILGTAAYGFAAANTVPETGAGDGTGIISGYAITNVTYTLDAVNPSNISQVAFTINPSTGAAAPASVQVKLVSASTAYSACTLAGTTATCPISGVTALAADELRVIAAQ